MFHYKNKVFTGIFVIRFNINRLLKTQFIGRTLIEVDRIDSTNNHALSLLREHPMPEGTVILASEQSQGRGMRGNTWKSEAGKNLTFTVLLEPLFLRPDRQFSLNMSISLAIHDFLSELELPNTAIKWPNDLLVNGKKVAGILMESQIIQNRFSRCIVGIGLNVNQTNFPGLPKATSIAAQLGQIKSLVEIRNRLFQSLEWRYLQLRSGTDPTKEYLQHLFRFGEMTHWIMESGDSIQARIVGVSEYGELELEDSKRLRSKYLHKEIRMSDF